MHKNVKYDVNVQLFFRKIEKHFEACIYILQAFVDTHVPMSLAAQFVLTGCSLLSSVLNAVLWRPSELNVQVVHM